MAQRLQVAAPEFNQRLQVAPLPGDTFAAPARPMIDNRAESLVDALGFFNQSLQNLGASNKAKRPSAADAERDIRLKYSSKTRKELADAASAGEIPKEIGEVENNASQKLFGTAYGAEQLDALKSHLGTDFNWDSEDPDKFITDFMNKDMEKFAGNKYAQAGYLAAMGGVRDWAIEQKKNRQDTKRIEANGQNTFTMFGKIADEGSAAGTKPEEIAKKIFDSYRVLGPDGTVGLPYESLDREAINIARKYADSNPELALAIMEGARQDSKGKPVASLAKRREFAQEYDAILNQARRAQAERASAVEIGGVRANDVQSMEDGTFDAGQVEPYRYRKPSGDEGELSPEDRSKETAKGYLRRSERIAAARRETPLDTAQREATAFRKAGIENPNWTRQFKSLLPKISPEAISDPESRAEIMKTVELYNVLQATDPYLASQHIDAETRDFLDKFMVARQFDSDPSGVADGDQAALTFAFQSSKTMQEMDPTRKAELTRDAYKEIDNQINKVGKNSSWFDWHLDDGVNNKARVSGMIQRIALPLIAQGMDPVDAVEKAGERVRKNSVNYHGNVMALFGMPIPPNFNEATDMLVGQYLKKYGKQQGLEPDEIVPEHLGGGAFVLKTKDGSMLRAGPDGGPAKFTIKDLQRMSGTITQMKQMEAVKAHEGRLDPWFWIRMGDFSPDIPVGWANGGRGMDAEDRARMARWKELSDKNEAMKKGRIKPKTPSRFPVGK